MTYSISIVGHGDEPYEDRKATEERLIAGLVDVLEFDGNNVSSFSFSGNEVRAATFDEAKQIVADAGTESA